MKTPQSDVRVSRSESPDGSPLEIKEVEQLERIERLADRYLMEFGSAPLNLSHWDPSKTFADRVLSSLRVELNGDPLNYIYSYTVDLGESVLRRLGFDPAEKGCLFTPSGTSSMLCAVNWLGLCKVKYLTAVGPLYFPLLHQAPLRNISVDTRYMLRQQGQYELPANLVSRDMEVSALWVTNPVYCTGVRLTNAGVSQLNDFLAAGVTCSPNPGPVET